MTAAIGFEPWKPYILALLLCTAAQTADPGRLGAAEFGIGEHHFDIAGFFSTGNALRLTDPGDLQIGFNEYERPTVFSQLNKLRFSLYGSHPHGINSLVSLDFFYASQPNRPFDDQGVIRPDEAYVDFRARNLDFRVGLQKVIWGKSDLISPFDVLTSRDLLDPFVYPTLENRIGQAGVRVNYSWEDYTLEAVYFPVWWRSRIPQAETDNNADSRVDEWFPPQAIYPSDAALLEPNELGLNWLVFLPTYNELEAPDEDLSSGTIGIKLNALKGDYDLDFYVLSAYDPMPTGNVTTALATGTLPEAGLYDVGMLISVEGNPEFKRMYAVGAAAARTFGAVAARSEFAVVAGKQYFRLFDPEELGEVLLEAAMYGYGEVRGEPKSHTELEWIVGGDYEIPGWFVLTSSQFAFTYRFGHEDFYTQNETEVDWTFHVQKGFLDDYLTLYTAGMVGFVSKAVWLSPGIGYTPPSYEDIQIGARFNLIGGDEFSRMGQYTDQSSFIATLRWFY